MTILALDLPERAVTSREPRLRTLEGQTIPSWELVSSQTLVVDGKKYMTVDGEHVTEGCINYFEEM